MSARRRTWTTAAKWLACGVAIAFFVRTLERSDLRGALGLIRSSGPAVAFIALPFLLAISLDAYACRLLFSVLRRRPTFIRLLCARISGEAVNMSLPAGGVWSESLNPFLLRSRCGIPGSEAVAGMAAKKWLQMRGHGIYIFTSFFVGYAFLRANSVAIIGVRGLPWLVFVSAFIPLGLSIAMALTLARGAVAVRLHGLLGRIPYARFQAWLARQRTSFTETDELFARFVVSAPPRVGIASGLFIASWLMESVETWLILHVLGAPVGFAEVISFEAGLSLVRNLAFFAPAGLGVQDVGYMAFLGVLGLPGFAALGAAFVLLKRAKELFWIAFGYALFLLPWAAPLLTEPRADLSAADETPTQ